MFALPQETHPERLWVLEQINSGEIILDLGCGKNKTLDKAIGIDILPVSDITISIDELPMEDNSVDIVISRHSLEHLIDTIKTLNEWKRVLRKDGKIIVVLPDHEYVDTMQPALSGGVHLHAFSRNSFKNLISVIPGLKIEKIETVIEEWSFGVVIKKL